MHKLILLFLLFPAAVFSQAVYPGKDWQQLPDSEARRWDNAKLQALRRFIADSANTTGIVVVQSGKILFESGDVQELSYLASCRKSVLAMLYGPFVDNKTINLGSSLEQLKIDDVGGLLPVEKTATIKDLLTARSGIYHPASNEGDATAMAPKRGTVKPGQFWLYNNWDFNAAGYILEQKTGRNIYQLIDSMLAKPLQMQDWQMEAQRKGGDSTRSKYLAYHMWFSTRDMARLGYLMLRKGKWKDKQLLSPSWISLITSPVTPYREAEQNKTAYFNFGYGYMWWVWDAPYNKGPYDGAFTASGAFGQFITVFPKLDLVVAHKTKYESGKQVTTDMYLRILSKLVEAHK